MALCDGCSLGLLSVWDQWLTEIDTPGIEFNQSEWKPFVNYFPVPGLCFWILPTIHIPEAIDIFDLVNVRLQSTFIFLHGAEKGRERSRVKANRRRALGHLYSCWIWILHPWHDKNLGARESSFVSRRLTVAIWLMEERRTVYKAVGELPFCCHLYFPSHLRNHTDFFTFTMAASQGSVYNSVSTGPIKMTIFF